MRYIVFFVLCLALLPAFAQEEFALPAGVVKPAAQVIGEVTAQPMALSPDGSLIAARQDDTTLVLLDAAKGAEVKKCPGHTGNITGAAFSPDNQFVATCALDGTVRLWEIKTGTAVRTLAKAEKKFLQLAYAPDGVSVVALSDDNVLWVMPAAGGDAKQVAIGGEERQISLAYSGDGQILLTAGQHSMYLWNPTIWKHGEKIYTIRSIVVCSKHTDVTATFGGSPFIRLRKSSDGSVLRECSGHKSEVIGGAFSANGEFLASFSSNEHELFLWEVNSGKLLFKLPLDSAASWVAFVPERNQLLAYTGKLCAWDMSLLTNPEKRAAFTACFNGEADNYAAFIRMFVLNAAARTPISFPGNKAGMAITTVTDREGQTTEILDATLGEADLAKGFAMTVGATQLTVQPRKVKSIEVTGTDEQQQVTVKVTTLDDHQLTAVMDGGIIKGRCAFGVVSVPLRQLAKLTFEQAAGEPAAQQPPWGDTPCKCEVEDRTGAKTLADDLRITPNSYHNLQIVVGLTSYRLSCKTLHALDVLNVVPGGVIVKLTPLDDHPLYGYLPAITAAAVQGDTALGDFIVNIPKLKAIRFLDK